MNNNDPTPPKGVVSIADKAKRLFTYLAERTKLRAGAVQDIRGNKRYADTIWLHDLPEIEEVWSLHREIQEKTKGTPESDDEDSSKADGEEAVLLSAEKPKLPKLPPPPKAAQAWLLGGERALARWDSEPPELLEFILVPTTIEREGESFIEDQRVFLNERPDVADAWSSYIDGRWKPWAEERARVEPLREVYARLFDMHTQLEREGEDYELVSCAGLLSWALGRATIYRHLATQPVRVELDDKTGRITVAPVAAEAHTRLETEMLPTARQPKVNGLQDIERTQSGDLSLVVSSSLAGTEVAAVLAGWGNRLDADCTTSSSARQPQGPLEDQPPTISFAPALILRKRPAIAMTIAFEQCAALVEANAEVPFNIHRVVEVVEDVSTNGAVPALGEESYRDADEAPLFPLPSNDDQVRVAQRLRKQRGVLVQGPPGTGKTLTIANLICHLLAQGQKVLVTSAKARPLNVLYDKLPSELKPLCLTSLGGGREETERLRASVQGILDRHSTYDPDVSRRDEEGLADQLETLAREEALLKNQRKDRWELEARSDHVVAGGRYSGRAMDVAKQVSSDEIDLGWFEDQVQSTQNFPLTEQDLRQVELYLSGLTPQLREECSTQLPSSDCLLAPAKLKTTFAERSSLGETAEQIRGEIDDVGLKCKSEQEERLVQLAAKVNAAREALTVAQGDYAVAAAKSSREETRIDAKKREIEEQHSKQVRNVTAQWQPAFAKIESEVAAAERVVAGIQHVPGRPGELVDRLSRLHSHEQRELSAAIQELTALLSRRNVSRSTASTSPSEISNLKINGLQVEWRAHAATDILNGSIDEWASLHDNTVRLLGALPELDRMRAVSEMRFDMTRLPEGFDASEVLEDARDLMDHFRRGGGKGIPLFRPRPVKHAAYMMKTVLVNGTPCDRLETVSALVDFLDAEEALTEVASQWVGFGLRRSSFDIEGDPLDASFLRIRDELLGPLTKLLELGPFIRKSLSTAALDSAGVGTAGKLLEALTNLETCREKQRELEAKLNAELKPLEHARDEKISDAEGEYKAADDSPVRQAQAELEELERQFKSQREAVADEYERELVPLRTALRATEERIAQLSEHIQSCKNELERVATGDTPHPSCEEMIAALDGEDHGRYERGFQRLQAVELALPKFKDGTTVLAKLTPSAPRTAEALRLAIFDQNWKQRVASLPSAWAFSQGRSWVRHFRTLVEARLDDKLRKVEERIRDTRAKQAATLAWRHCLEKASEVEKRSLMAWQQAMKRYGKGTGTHAARHRSNAMREMRKAQGMIPALVTPLARLVEGVAVRPKLFDVVIIDEASQLGPEGLLLFYIADRVVVVGDDQQISPEDVGVDQRELHAQVKRHLYDIPQAERLEQESVFNLASMLFSGGRIMLKEHFRCMPEIIRFSNELCYRDETGRPQLIPLRKFSGKRLEPVLKTVFVESGYRTGDINKPEIDAIVQAIRECIEDPAYAGKEFGVITLHGHAQADAIQRAVNEAIGADEVAARRLICGNAYAFQGDERHVMFLSLVVAGNQRIMPLTKEVDNRRFNVAASRARDQMWLFHSARLEDLKPIDLRHKLLHQCLTPSDPL
ncbi:MAG: hypothetical protein KDB29_12795, partial [Planctomycetes bacterium]|nr:hypothetical protein [Planctomycetota bacterium]